MMNCIQAITRIRERIHDRGALNFDDDEILRALDDSLKQISTALRTHGEFPNLQSVDVTLTSLTTLDLNVASWTPPSNLGDIQLIEFPRQNGPPLQARKVSLEHKDVMRGFVTGSEIVWHWGPARTIHVRGSLSGATKMTVWFLPIIPPMVYGTTPPSTVPGYLEWAVDPHGEFRRLYGSYGGFQVEVVQSGAVALDVYGISSSDATGTYPTMVCPDITVAAVDTKWATIIPVDDEYTEYVLATCCMKLFRRAGSAEDIEALSGEMALLKQEFESGIARRSSGEPPRLWSSRQIR